MSWHERTAVGESFDLALTEHGSFLVYISTGVTVYFSRSREISERAACENCIGPRARVTVEFVVTRKSA